MQTSRKKVAIIGVGAVGTSLAYALINQEICDELVLINRTKNKAEGEALDLQQSVEYTSRNAQVYAGDYSDCRDADMVVFTLGASPSQCTSREHMIEGTCLMIREAVQQVMQSGFNGFILNISNPVDAVTHFIYRLSGLPKNRVMGTGTALDSTRLRLFLSQNLGMSPKCINGYVMGEHGASMMVPWSLVNVGGKPIEEMLEDNPKWNKPGILKSLLADTVSSGDKIKNLKGTTCFGIAMTATAIIRSILFNQDHIYSLSVCLDGVYGYHGEIFAGIPALINGMGVKDTGTLHLPEGEHQLLEASFKKIEEAVEKTKIFY